MTIRLAGLAAATLALTAPVAQAATVTLDFTVANAAGTLPTGTVTATFKDLVAGKVQLDLTVPGSSSQFVSVATFNLNGATATSLKAITITEVSGATATVTRSLNGIKAGPYSGYDLELNFPTSKSGRLAGGSTAEFILAAAGLTASQFDSAASSSNPYAAVVHVQGLAGGSSQWMAAKVSAVPVPPALLLFASAVGGLAVFRRRRSPERKG